MSDSAPLPIASPVTGRGGIYRHRVTMFGRPALYARGNDGVVIEAARPRDGETEDDIIVLLAASLRRYERTLRLIPGAASPSAELPSGPRPVLLLL